MTKCTQCGHETVEEQPRIVMLQKVKQREPGKMTRTKLRIGVFLLPKAETDPDEKLDGNQVFVDFKGIMKVGEGVFTSITQVINEMLMKPINQDVVKTEPELKVLDGEKKDEVTEHTKT